LNPTLTGVEPTIVLQFVHLGGLAFGHGEPQQIDYRTGNKVKKLISIGWSRV
jgi:hypothetical protein